MMGGEGTQGKEKTKNSKASWREALRTLRRRARGVIGRSFGGKDSTTEKGVQKVYQLVVKRNRKIKILAL